MFLGLNREYLLKGISTIDLYVLASSDELLIGLRFSFTKQVILMMRHSFGSCTTFNKNSAESLQTWCDNLFFLLLGITSN